ncbi:hypothetical protein Q9L42_021210 (plasmid) [Methylomarinum sp. Ch1-1]|uniref:Uncharacterized protein n=1 Tax=Methylomarinum roseum TaxID=3067653 RepID=A0AAU7P0P3_9GAMM|nr:hypothetical protein [Methylomarinum sp. Ch1-1]MDP4523180.1 hypothetical protein [Methylomarinum sp. Ch1-1]
MNDVKFGCVRFEDPYQHNSGWASINGGKAFRIRGTENLPSDVVFMLNLERDLMFRCGFKSHSRYRSSEYLSLRYTSKEISPRAIENSNVTWMPYSIMNVLGVREDDWPTQVQSMSTIFGRVMKIGWDRLGLKTPPPFSLDYGVRQELAPPDDIVPRRVVNALSESTVHYIQSEVNADIYSGGYRRFQVAIPRVKHAINILNSFMPSSDWKLVGKKSLPVSSESIVNWLREQEGCVLARIVVNELNPALGRLINFGSGQDSRRWVTMDELVWLSELGNVQILEAYVSKGFIENQKIKDLIEPIKELGDVADLSVSLGLFMESFWVGAAKTLAPRPEVLKEKFSANSSRPFYKARDLMSCLDAAISLQAAGVHVVGYGKGKIGFLTDLDDYEVGRICAKLGLIPPALNIQNPDYLDYTKPIDVLLGMTLKSDTELLLDTDKNVLETIL